MFSEKELEPIKLVVNSPKSLFEQPVIKKKSKSIFVQECKAKKISASLFGPNLKLLKDLII